MTNEEKILLITYLIDAGDIDPDVDVEVQFMTGIRSEKAWYPERRTTRPSSRPPRSGGGAINGGTVTPVTPEGLREIRHRRNRPNSDNPSATTAIPAAVTSRGMRPAGPRPEPSTTATMDRTSTPSTSAGAWATYGGWRIDPRPSPRMPHDGPRTGRSGGVRPADIQETLKVGVGGHAADPTPAVRAAGLEVSTRAWVV